LSQDIWGRALRGAGPAKLGGRETLGDAERSSADEETKGTLVNRGDGPLHELRKPKGWCEVASALRASRRGRGDREGRRIAGKAKSAWYGGRIYLPKLAGRKKICY